MGRGDRGGARLCRRRNDARPALVRSSQQARVGIARTTTGAWRRRPNHERTWVAHASGCDKLCQHERSVGVLREAAVSASPFTIGRLECALHRARALATRTSPTRAHSAQSREACGDTLAGAALRRPVRQDDRDTLRLVSSRGGPTVPGLPSKRRQHLQRSPSSVTTKRGRGYVA